MATGLRGPAEEGDDGVVAYRSAHIDEAVSEVVVRSGHSVQSNSQAIEEIRRILLEHAATQVGDSQGSAASAPSWLGLQPASPSPARPAGARSSSSTSLPDRAGSAARWLGASLRSDSGASGHWR